MQTSSKDELYRKLARIVGPERVRTDESYLDERSWDALSEDRIHPLKRPETNLPLCVVLPSDTVQVSEIVRLANEEKVPVLPYGGGSGLMGGALSVRAGMVVDRRRRLFRNYHEGDDQDFSQAGESRASCRSI